jgi:hypothetical protein
MAPWVALLVAFLAALASVSAAIISGAFARRTTRANIEAERTRDLESRNSERKYAIYEPMINDLTEMMRGRGDPDERRAKFDQFSTWIGIYGSDEAVTAFSRFMQTIYNDPPPSVMLRLFGDFMLAARADMGHPGTQLSRVKLLAMKVNNIYQYPDVTDRSLAEVCKRHNWDPPWLAAEPANRQPE